MPLTKSSFTQSDLRGQGKASRLVEPHRMPMTKKQKIEYLRKVGLFSGVSPRALGLIADKLEEIDFPAGRYIVRQGQVGTGCYLITRGTVSVVRGGETLASLGPGDLFGELSVLDQLPRVAHVIAAEPTSCLALASWDFTDILERNPKITLAVLREVARRLRDTSDVRS
jgi:CRP/FNR family cyclic AMP-dependent transcriptional regulator